MSIQHDLEIQQTKRLDRRLGGELMRGSGQTPGHKGDREFPPFLFEQKTTGKASQSVKREWLAKIEKEAFERKLVPGVLLSFENMPYTSEKDWVVVRLETFKKLLSGGYNEESD